jgi:hypothetical protein
MWTRLLLNWDHHHVSYHVRFASAPSRQAGFLANVICMSTATMQNAQTRNSAVPAPGRCITERIPGTLILSVVEHCIIVPKLLRLELPSRTSIVAWRAPLLVHEPKRGVHEERCMACAYVLQRYCIRRKSQWHRVVNKLHIGRGAGSVRSKRVDPEDRQL